MKILLGFLILFFVLSSPVSAHLAGQPPFFKINGVYSALYPVPMTSIEELELPQDIAPQSYLVGETIEFEIDRSQIPVLPSIIDKTTFYWDFGDGTKAEGLKNSHTYTKQGSYILKIQAQYQQDLPQLLQSVLINILPNNQYQLPSSIISIDGFVTKDILTDPFILGSKKEVTFDGTKSKSSSKIVSYEWDFGDGEDLGKGSSIKHKFTKDYNQFYPVLRIKTEDGFTADTYMEIKQKEDGGNGLGQNSRGNTMVYDLSSKIALGAFIVITLVILFFIIKGLKKRIK